VNGPEATGFRKAGNGLEESFFAKENDAWLKKCARRLQRQSVAGSSER